MKYRVLAKAIELSVPFLNLFRNPPAWPYSLEELEKMGENTYGRALFHFLNKRNLGYLPKYEIHDAYHALLNYGTTVTEELKLQAFMWGNKNSTFAGRILFLIGYLLFPSKKKILKDEIRKGGSAKPLKGIDLASLMNQDLNKIRIELCINLD